MLELYESASEGKSIVPERQTMLHLFALLTPALICVSTHQSYLASNLFTLRLTRLHHIACLDDEGAGFCSFLQSQESLDQKS